MESFKKKLCGLKGGSYAGCIVLLVIAAVLAVYGFAQGQGSYKPFDPTSGGNVKLRVKYVMGPFAEMTNENDITTDEFYIAEDDEGYWYILGTDAYNELPVYGEDVNDDTLAALPTTTVFGRSTTVPDEMVPYIVDFFSDTDAGLTVDNYDEFFGDHYLDSTAPAIGENSIFFYIMAGVFALIALILLAPADTGRKRVKAQLVEMEQNGRLQPIYEDFVAGQPFYSAPLKLALSDRYILDFSVAQGGFAVLQAADVTNVYKSRMVNGNPSTTTYLVLENEQGQQYGLAPNAGKSKDLEVALLRLKASIANRRASV